MVLYGGKNLLLQDKDKTIEQLKLNEGAQLLLHIIDDSVFTEISEINN